MAYRLQVSCILKRHTNDPGNAIEAIGGLTSDGAHWWLSHQDAIEGLENSRWLFYVEDDLGSAVRLVVAATNGHKYLKADTDPAAPVTLLSLPECATAKAFVNGEAHSPGPIHARHR